MGMPKTLIEAVRFFESPVNCREYMVSQRWPEGVRCPQCGSDAVYFDQSRNGWECKTRHPKRKFTLKTGTIFEDSPLGLDKWLPCVWMIVNAKNGVSSHEIARSIGVTQKTAWFMLQRIRLAMQEDNNGGGGKLGGDVEVDETYIGAKARNMHHDRKERTKAGRWHGKVAVMGLLERNTSGPSRVRTRIVNSTKRGALVGPIKENVELGSNLYSDALPTYSSMNHMFVHQFVDHAEAYAIGNVHTNGLENYWSLLKRALHGTYVAVEPFHLFRYLDEQAFRFNNRDWTDSMRFSAVIKAIVGKRLTYEQVTGAVDAATA
jgi:transposase-like protein